MSQYRLGRELYSVKSQLSSIESEISRAEDVNCAIPMTRTSAAVRDELDYLYDKTDWLK